MLDRSNGCMAYTVLSTGGTGTRTTGQAKTVAVPWAVYSPTSDLSVLTVSVDRDRIYNAPVFDYTRIDEYASSGYINNIYSYYGVSAQVGVTGQTSVTGGATTAATGATASQTAAASPGATAGGVTRTPSPPATPSPRPAEPAPLEILEVLPEDDALEVIPVDDLDEHLPLLVGHAAAAALRYGATSQDSLSTRAAAGAPRPRSAPRSPRHRPASRERDIALIPCR